MVHICLITGRQGFGYYSEDISGQRLDGMPIIDLSPITTTKEAAGITLKGALLNGTVYGNCLYTNVYFEFGASTNYGMTFDANESYLISQTTTSPFCVTHTISYYVSGLTSGTLYHYRAKAVNSNGTTYGSDMTFTTPTPTDSVTDIDGNVYSTVPIGNQIWTAENLKVTHFNDGTAIPAVPDNKAWIDLTTPGYCWYNNDSVTYKANYGALYNWYSVSTGKLCPNGWHVPDNDEWIIFSNSLGGGGYNVGSKLWGTGIANSSGTSPETNVTGFTALLGGYRYFDSFERMGNWTCWWSTTEVPPIGSSESDKTYCFDTQLLEDEAFKEFGLSVRCLKDN